MPYVNGEYTEASKGLCEECGKPRSLPLDGGIYCPECRSKIDAIIRAKYAKAFDENPTFRNWLKWIKKILFS